MTPHLARNDESPQDVQNRQGTTAAASTSTAAATATTATMVGKVGDADPVHDESAEEDPIILSNSYNWIIEGVEELDEEKIRHMNAFYALLKKWIRGKEYTSKLITKEDYNARVNFLLRVKEVQGLRWPLKKLKLMPYHQGATISVTEPQRIWLRRHT